MSTLQFSCPFTPDQIDDVNAVIRGVSVMTKGMAKGHQLLVDDLTLSQVHGCGSTKGQVPVRIDHQKNGGGAASVCGFLDRFRIVNDKVVADWTLLKSHPMTEIILETARRMPGGVGLSASFVAPENAEHGKARCQELLTVDYVVHPAANVSLFSRRFLDPRLVAAQRARLKTGDFAAADGHGKPNVISRRVADMAKAGASLFEGPHAQRLAKQRSGVFAGRGIAALARAKAGLFSPLAGEIKRDFAARVIETVFADRRATIQRIADSVSNNVQAPDIPGVEGAKTVVRQIKKPLVRRVAGKLVKVAAGATAGYYIGRRYGAKAGAATGGLAGLLFNDPSIDNAARLATTYAKKITL